MAQISLVNINWWKHLKYDKSIILKSGVNLIIGKNGSGKTSLLKMIDEASKGNNPGLVEEAHSEPDKKEMVRIGFGEGAEMSIMQNVKKGEGTEWVAQNLLHDNVRYITSQRTIASGNTTKNLLAQSISGDVAMPASDQPIDVAEEFNKAINRELHKRLLEMRETADFLNDLQESYQSGLVDFEKFLKIDLTRENAIYFLDHRSKEVQIQDLSSGEKEYLYFYAFLKRIQEDEDKIILIDEPELHLHSSQIRKLCELIARIGLKNQIIIATHSGEVLQYFISQANLILLSKGTVTNISETEQLKTALEETGLPIDPSVFTAHWVCAENEPTKTLAGGELAPTTPEAMSWIFGKDISKRYWSFGSNKALAEAHIEGINEALAGGANIKLTAILDGDKLVKDFDLYPPNIPEIQNNLGYFPFWEFENLFLNPGLINEIIPTTEGKNGYAQLWDSIEANQGQVKAAVIKTVAKNKLRAYWPDKYIKNDTPNNFTQWQQDVAGVSLNLTALDAAFAETISEKKWQWLPGKEVLGLALQIKPNFWSAIRDLQAEKKLKQIMDRETIIKDFVEKIECLH